MDAKRFLVCAARSGFLVGLLIIAASCDSSSTSDGMSTDDLETADLVGTDAGGQSLPDGGGFVDMAVVDSSAIDSGTVVVTSNDAFSASRTACINEINRLRATQSLLPYTIVNTDTVNTCVDAQATSDEMHNSPHQAWGSGTGSCDGNAQNECEGYGTNPAGIVACLDDMWAEQNQPNCAGCVGCKTFGGACNNCDFFGTNGPECGHYVNMSASYFTRVACGFSTLPSGGWAAQNFFQ